MADDSHEPPQDDVLARVFPGAEPEDDASSGAATADSAVDERRQRLIEPLGDPDREPW